MENHGKVDELNVDGIRLIRKDAYVNPGKWNFAAPIKRGKELSLFFSTVLEAMKLGLHFHQNSGLALLLTTSGPL